MLVPSNCDELELIRQEYETMKTQDSSFAMTLVPFNGCNFLCNYCFEDIVNNKDVLSPEDQQKTLDRIEAILTRPNLKQFDVTWFGGEPLAKSDIVIDMSDRIVQLCKKHAVGLGQNIITNGYFLDDKILADLGRLEFVDIQVTIDTVKQIHDQRRPLRGGQGTWDRVFENTINAINNHQVHVSIRINIDAQLMERPHYVAKFLDQLKARVTNWDNVNVSFGRLENIISGCHSDGSLTYPQKFKFAKFAFKFYTRNRKKYPFLGNVNAITRGVSAPCGAVTNNHELIDADGSVKCCWNHVGFSEWNIGDLSTTETKNPWLDYDPTTGAICSECSFLPFCMGGCPDIYYKMMKLTGRGDCTLLRGYVGDIVRYIDYLQRKDDHESVEAITGARS